ncbi:MAG: phosphoribosylglycinamide formyltransferase-1 [Vicingaceae bacterium]|jgi:phosphoribosylglycinamide formyltransferase-1
MSKVAIFASGAGSNADRILQFLAERQSLVEIDCIITNRELAGIYTVANKFDVPIYYFSNSDFAEGTVVLDFLQKRAVEWIVLAGFLRKIEPILVDAFKNKIFNLHPALLPNYGGKGMYGKFVHEAVLAAGEKESGISIHLVNSEFDKGAILFQAKCDIAKGQTVQGLAEKIQKLEHEYFALTIVQHINNIK